MTNLEIKIISYIFEKIAGSLLLISFSDNGKDLFSLLITQSNLIIRLYN